MFICVHSCSIWVNSSSIRVHSCSIRVHSCSFRVRSCSIRVHLCSLVFSCVRSCSLVFWLVWSFRSDPPFGIMYDTVDVGLINKDTSLWKVCKRLKRINWSVLMRHASVRLSPTFEQLLSCINNTEFTCLLPLSVERAFCVKIYARGPEKKFYFDIKVGV